VAAAALVAVFAAAPVMAGDSFGARLRGFEEVRRFPRAGPRASFWFRLAESMPGYTVTYFASFYFGLQGRVTQAHLHIGQPAVNGGNSCCSSAPT
jgi:hypothetical protein